MMTMKNKIYFLVILMSNSIEVDNFSSIKDILYNESNLLKRKVKEDEEEDDEVITIDPKI